MYYLVGLEITRLPKKMSQMIKDTEDHSGLFHLGRWSWVGWAIHSFTPFLYPVFFTVPKVRFAPFQNMLPLVCTEIQDDDAFRSLKLNHPTICWPLSQNRLTHQPQQTQQQHLTIKKNIYNYDMLYYIKHDMENEPQVLSILLLRVH